LNVSAKHVQQPIVVPRFFDEIGAPGAHSFDGEIHAAPCGHQNHRQRVAYPVNLREQLQTLTPGRRIARIVHAEQEHVVLLGLDCIEHSAG
jgi:hypothetical protein